MKAPCLVLLVFSFCLWSSCKDDNKDTTACEVDDFLGLWDMNEQCDSSDAQYQLTVTKLASGIRLTNLGNGGSTVFVDATVNGASFSIAPQPVSTGYTVSGNGSLNAGCAQLTLSWHGGPNGSCAGTATR